MSRILRRPTTPEVYAVRDGRLVLRDFAALQHKDTHPSNSALTDERSDGNQETAMKTPARRAKHGY